MNLRIGDIVQLKTGGPSMTIDEVIGDEVECSWLENNSPKRRRGSFDVNSLVQV